MIRALPLLIVAALWTLGPQPYAAAVEPVPVVSVALGDGVEIAEPGSSFVYVATVRNEGAHPFAGTVVLEVPPFVALDAPSGEVSGGEVSWQVELAPGEAAELSANGVLGEVPDDEYQVLAMVTVEYEGDVIARSADADAIPGAEAPPPVEGMTGEESATPAWVWPVVIGAVVLFLLIDVLVIVVMSRRRMTNSSKR